MNTTPEEIQSIKEALVGMNVIDAYDYILELEQQIQKMKDNAHHAVMCLTDDDGYPYPDNHLTNLALEYLSKVKGEDYRHGPDYHDEL